ncbi:HNH endonuclease [Frankia sp. AgPm24]|uniref:HNH endonuclease signature motif containing protein n=1 Tax=Frankia sp. AgPm24 TaxID=631128 RepID=UPI00200ED744|nr:HNH endonuclease signature motif containing protein [Frankia sp. AgPm24]MCK9921022.1 HNH endonuclease [Frankia sp. AgPm24]
MLIHPNGAAGPEPPGGSADIRSDGGNGGFPDAPDIPAAQDVPAGSDSFDRAVPGRVSQEFPTESEEDVSEFTGGAGCDSSGSCAGEASGDGRSEAESLLGALAATVEGLLGSQAWRWSSDDVTEAICALRDLDARLAAVRSIMLLEAQDRGLASNDGAIDLARWLAGRLVLPKSEAARQVALAEKLFAGPYRATGEALAAARISADHALVIMEGLDVLPEHLPEAVRAKAEAHLLEDASQLDWRQLKRAAIRLREQLTQVDTSPGGDDPHEDSRTGEHSGSRGCAGEESEGEDEGGSCESGAGGDVDGTFAGGGRWHDPLDARGLTFVDTPEGTTLIRGELDAEGAALLRTALDGLSAPAPGKNGVRDLRSPARRRADALVEFVRRALSADVGPAAGGTRPHLTVVIGWDTFLGDGNEPAMTEWGLPLSREAILRISCDAQVGRIILGPDSVPLDVGRSERIVPPHIRRALVSRDVCCAFPYCDRPSSWCDAHHVKHWVDGGETKIDNLVLLCSRHHRRVHREKWQIVVSGDRRPSFIPPSFIDPQRRPRRNPYAQPPPDMFSGLLG